MKLSFFILFALCAITSFGQSLDEVSELYKQKNYDKALERGSQLLQKDSSSSSYHIIGRILVDIGKEDSAIFYLTKALVLDHDSSWISAWSHAYLGKAYLIKGEKKKAKSELKKTIDLNKTKNSVDFAQKLLNRVMQISKADDKFAADGSLALKGLARWKWITIEGKNITYSFYDTTGWGNRIRSYMARHEEIYEKINEVFHAKMPKKLTYYIWENKAEGEAVIGRSLGFTEPQNCICYVHSKQSVGHEMTHALSYWGWGVATFEKTRFINEGVAVAFDQHKDYYKTYYAKNALQGTSFKSVLNVWKSDRELTETVLYPIAGAFVQFLYSKSDSAQFKSLIKEQSIRNAKRIYGKEQFKAMVSEFDKLVGLIE